MKPETLFISRAGADAAFAAEIGRILEAAGYGVILQQWDFANRNFIERIHESLAGGAQVVALLSPDYLRTDYCAAEWQNAIAGDPLNTKGRLVLLRVAECEPVGLLAGIAYWDLVPIRDNRTLLAEVVRTAVRTDRRDAAPVDGPYRRAPRTILDAEAIRPTLGFTGREEELTAIACALRENDAVAAIHGLGGTGKSSLAREFAWRHRDEHSVVWWLNAESESAVIDGLLHLGGLFVRGLDQLADRRAAAQQVTTTVLAGFAKPVMLIFDNLEDEQLLRVWRPRTQAHIVATSRNSAWGSDVVSIPVTAWPLADAIAYLRRESGRNDFSEAEARALAERLGSLPLALAHAAAYLRGTRMVTPSRYLERIADHLAGAPRTAEYPRSVFATFQTAIAEAEQQAPGAAAVLCLAAQFAPDAIPDELFRQSLDLYPEGLRPVLPADASALDLRASLTDGMRVDEALGALDRLSLLGFSEATQTYSLHRLVQMAARDLVGTAARRWTEGAVATTDVLFPPVEFGTWPQCERMIAHARVALDDLPDDTAFLPASRLANRCSEYLTARALYAEAGRLAQRALTILERALGAEHPDVAQSLTNLANAHWRAGRYAEAESVYARSLTIYEHALGPDHPEVGKSLNNLAGAYLKEGRYAEAASLFARSLTIWEKARGPEHHNVAIALNNLAGVYVHEGRYSEAEPLYARALAIQEKVLGPGDPAVAMSLCNLGNLAARQERFADAEQPYRRALAIWEEAVGADHPDVGDCLNGLAHLYVKQARYPDAEPLALRALAIREKVLGGDHADVAETLGILSELYSNQGRHDEALQTAERALAIFEKALGSQHPATLTAHKDLAAMKART